MSATFDTVALRTTRSPGAFEEMFVDRPRHQIVRVGVFDDSQSVNTPTYSTYLNYHWYRRFGNSPETPLYPITAANELSCAFWLASLYKPDAVSQRTAASKVPPGLSSFGYLNGSTHFGFMTVADPTCYYAGEPTPSFDPFIRRLAPPYYFNRGSDLANASCEADLFAATNAVSGEVFWEARPFSSPAGGYGGATSTTGTTALTLQSGTFAVKKATVTLPYSSGNGFMGFNVRGSHASNPTDIMGARIRSLVAPFGVVSTPLGIAGYKASDFAASHSACGEALTTMGFDAFEHAYSTNDADQGVTAAQFKINTAANIDLINSFYDTAGLRRPPHILRADSYDTRLVGSKLTQANLYPGVLAELAMERNDVLAINSRRITDGCGWNATGYANFTVDGVHYNRVGGRVQAQTDVSLICAREDVKTYVSFPTNTDGTVRGAELAPSQDVRNVTGNVVGAVGMIGVGGIAASSIVAGALDNKGNWTTVSNLSSLSTFNVASQGVLLAANQDIRNVLGDVSGLTADAVADILGTAVDGVAVSSILEALLAVIAGKASVVGNTVTFRKRDGTTAKVVITYGPVAGQRTGSTIS